MKGGTGLKISATVIALLLGGSIYYVFRDKKRSQLAAQLLEELNSRFSPSSLGLAQEKAFDMKYTQRVLATVQGQVLVLKESRAKQLALQLHRAWKPWLLGGDDEDRVYGIFRELDDKVQVSQVAKAYHKEYQISIIDKLVERLDTKEINKLLSIVRKLPDYRTL